MSNTTKKCVIYARLSNDEQGEIPVRLKKYAENIGFEVIEEFFEQDNTSNVEFERMLKFLETSPKTSVVFEKLGRKFEDLPTYYSICEKDHTLYFRKQGIYITKDMIPHPIIQTIQKAFTESMRVNNNE